MGDETELGPERASGIVQARLGRGAQDALEAAVVLEAWGGVRGAAALAVGSRVVPVETEHQTRGRLTVEETGQRGSVLAEGIALVMAILAVASWAAPLSHEIGASVLEHAIVVALPLTIALQWAIRSRYLSRRSGLACLAHDRLPMGALALLGVEGPLLLMPRFGPLAAMFVAVWVSGTILARRGWGLLYGLLLVAVAVGLELQLAAYPLIGALTAITLAASVLAIRSGGGLSDEPAGRPGRALWAAAIGAALGGLLVGDPSLGWGVHGAFPALALLPSVLGSFWGGYYLWQLYDAVPRSVHGMKFQHANERVPRGPTMSIFLGSLLRLLGTTVVLSAVVILFGHWTSGSNRLSLFVGFACVAIFSQLISLLESLAYVQWALLVALLSMAVELALSEWVRTPVPGMALIVGAGVGILVALPLLIRCLLHPGRMLATSLWIQ
jgi:hypothetical protein